jgi:thioredoxin 1
MAALTEVSDATFQREVLDSSGTVLVEFWAEWCPPCRALGPVLEQIAAENPDRLTVVKVNADDNLESAVRYRAMSLPTMAVFQKGEVVGTIIGAMSKAALDAALARHLVPAEA